ncbi:uncharacterized protein [Epargyreus clarus]|uniref:uncharacterized protein n=1 Tax=Epargyreus clarus TaxID=520877 RepID=UPI003C2BA41A
MSIKSQKSLNDECSEIFEKSYSVRSASDESLSCSDDEECLARELINKLTPAVLSKLRRCFKKAKARNNARDIDRRVEEVMRAAAAEEGIEFAATPATPHALCLDERAFVNAVNNIFGHHKYSPHAHTLFQSLDPFCSGRVWWRQVVARLVAAGARKTSSREERWTPVTEGGIRRLDHCKRETIVKLVSIEREDSFCYAAVSKGGRIGVYSGQLKLLNSYEVFYHRTGLRRRVKNCWITDAIYLNDVQNLMLSASDRSLIVYDVTTLTHTPLYCITGLPNIPTCLAYQPAIQVGESSELVFGTERGDLTRMRFLQPRISLFHTNTPDNINYYFWMELPSPPHSSYCSISTWRRVHARGVRRVALVRDGDIVLSCSHDAVAVRAKHVPGKLEDYVFKVQRGVSCFHVVSSLHLLVCGSSDGIVRLWDTTQAEPFARLNVPGSPAVLDVAVVASEQIIVAYCSNCVIYIWDLYEECLLQSVKIKFPFIGVLGKRVEFGTYCIHPGPPRKKESENDNQQEEDTLDVLSRRGSSVYQASTGGLVLQPELKPESWENRDLEKEPEYIRFNRCELLITCCDYVFTLVLREAEGAALPPPGDTLRARRPSHWELPSDLLAPIRTPTSNPRPSLPTARLLAPETAEHPLQDIDELLHKAGLQGILEKDFVLMQGLKHDLNKKIYDMETNMEATRAAVSAGAPYLALKSYEPDPLPQLEPLAEQCERIMRMFPVSSTVVTPSGSDRSTSRHSKSFRL